jgi:hypothetical protein
MLINIILSYKRKTKDIDQFWELVLMEINPDKLNIQKLLKYH